MPGTRARALRVILGLAHRAIPELPGTLELARRATLGLGNKVTPG